MCVYVYTRQKNSFRPTGPRFLGLQVRERGSESLHPFSKTTIYQAPLFQQETIDCFSLARFPTNGVSHRETNTYFWFFGVPGYDQGVIVLHKTLGLAELRGQPVRPSAAQPQSNPSLRHFLGIVAHAFPKLQLFLIKAAGRKTAGFSVQIEEPNSCAQAIWVYPATLDFWIWYD